MLRPSNETAMKDTLQYLFEHRLLSREKSREILLRIGQGEFNEPEIAAFLTVFVMRRITVEELAGFREAMLELCLPVDFEGAEAIDLCGTGGDGKNTFNISTLSSFVVAGAGGKVAKHGNYGVSSASGSSNVMEHLGYAFSSDEDRLKKELDRTGITFLHAPLFHPAMKNVAPVRKKLGVKTFFNMLGPMVNPSSPDRQLVGVFDLELARLYHYLYEGLNKHYCILHSLDGYDEVSLTGEAKVYRNGEEGVLRPADFGMQKVAPEDLFGGDSVEEAGEIFISILQGKGTEAQNNAVIANSALALSRTPVASDSMEDDLEKARDSLLGGQAYSTFQKLIELNQH